MTPEEYAYVNEPFLPLPGVPPLSEEHAAALAFEIARRFDKCGMPDDVLCLQLEAFQVLVGGPGKSCPRCAKLLAKTSRCGSCGRENATR